MGKVFGRDFLQRYEAFRLAVLVGLLYAGVMNPNSPAKSSGLRAVFRFPAMLAIFGVSVVVFGITRLPSFASFLLFLLGAVALFPALVHYAKEIRLGYRKYRAKNERKRKLVARFASDYTPVMKSIDAVTNSLAGLNHDVSEWAKVFGTSNSVREHQNEASRNYSAAAGLFENLETGKLSLPKLETRDNRLERIITHLGIARNEIRFAHNVMDVELQRFTHFSAEAERYRDWLKSTEEIAANAGSTLGMLVESYDEDFLSKAFELHSEIEASIPDIENALEVFDLDLVDRNLAEAEVSKNKFEEVLRQLVEKVDGLSGELKRVEEIGLFRDEQVSIIRDEVTALAQDEKSHPKLTSHVIAVLDGLKKAMDIDTDSGNPDAELAKALAPVTDFHTSLAELRDLKKEVADAKKLVLEKITSLRDEFVQVKLMLDKYKIPLSSEEKIGVKAIEETFSSHFDTIIKALYRVDPYDFDAVKEQDNAFYDCHPIVNQTLSVVITKIKAAQKQEQAEEESRKRRQAEEDRRKKRKAEEDRRRKRRRNSSSFSGGGYDYGSFY